MKKNALRIFALVLSVIMMLGTMTVVSFADGETEGTSLAIDPAVNAFGTWVTTFDATELPDGYNTIKYDYVMSGSSEITPRYPYGTQRNVIRDADGAFIIGSTNGVPEGQSYTDGTYSGTASVDVDLTSLNRNKISEFGVMFRVDVNVTYVFSNVRATNGTDEILLSADGRQKYTPDYLYKSEAKHFVAETNTSYNSTFAPGFNVGYSFTPVDLTNVTKLTVGITVNTPIDNMLMDGPGYYKQHVYLFDVNGNSVQADIIMPADACGNLSIDVQKRAFATNEYFDITQVARVEFDLLVNRVAAYAVDSIKFDDTAVENLAIVSMTQGGINTADTVAANGFSFSFEAPVDMSAQTSLSYFKTYINSQNLEEVPALHRGKIALTDADGKIYMLETAATGHSPEAYQAIVDAGVQYTTAISADAAAAIGFDLANVVQVDFYFAQNRESAVRIHRLTMSDGTNITNLSASNSDIYYGGAEDAFLVVNGVVNTETSVYVEIEDIDVATYSTLKVVFTPINVTEGANTKIGDGPYMWKLVYTLTSSTGNSVEIKSTKDNLGDLHGTQLETLAVTDLEDVVKITVTLIGNKTSDYYFDFSFVNGDGVEVTPEVEVEIPGGEEPGGDTPGGDTPGGDTPGGDTPSGDTPSGDTPSGDTPNNDSTNNDTTDASDTEADTTDSKADETTKAPADTTEKATEKNGCGSSIAIGMVLVATVATAGVVISRKRED